MNDDTRNTLLAALIQIDKRSNILTASTAYFNLNIIEIDQLSSIDLEPEILLESINSLTYDIMFSFSLSILAANIISNNPVHYHSSLRSSLRKLISLALPNISSKLRSFILLEAEYHVSHAIWSDFLDKQPVQEVKMSDSRKKTLIGLATFTGAIAIGLTGGLAAPIIGVGLGSLITGVGVTGALASSVSLITNTPNSSVIESLFGIRNELESFKLSPNIDFKFINVLLPQQHCLIVYIVFCLENDINLWQGIQMYSPFSEIIAVTILNTLSQKLETQVIKHENFESTYNQVTSFSNVLSNQLSHTLASKTLGSRPLCMIACFTDALTAYKTLIKMPFGMVDSVYFILANIEKLIFDSSLLKNIVAGRIVNIYISNDLSLNQICGDVVGISRIPGVENFDVSCIPNLSLGNYKKHLDKIFELVGIERDEYLSNLT